MGASFTLAGEDLIAQKQAAKQTLTVSRFILANVPGLNPNGPVDRAAGKPAAAQIIDTYPVTQAGYVNPSQVVYSLMLGSDIGDFDWNWVGLESAEGVLLMVAYVPLQQKRRNIPPLQLGNNVTRNFLLKFDGAQELTGVTIDANTWQHDFTVRLAGIDERERLANRDVFGRACFFGSALQLEKVGSAYQLKPGTAYVEGVRLQSAAPLPVVPPALPATAWLDVALQRELSDVVASWSVVWGAGKADYLDSTGVQHYCVPIADLVNANTIIDRRPVENIAGPLVTHFAARVGDYAQLRARATTKDDVGLDQIPNGISSNKDHDSAQHLATTRMVQLVRALLAPLESPILTGTPKAPTQQRATSNTSLANTEFVMREVQELLQELAKKAAIASPVLTGAPRSTTPAVTDNSDRISTTAHTQAAIAAALASPVQGSSTNYSVTLPGGLILKLGTFNKGANFGEGEQTTITFTDAFPNACLWGGAFQGNSRGVANAETMYLLRSKSKVNAVIWAEHVVGAGMNGQEFSWIFIGN